MKTIEQKAAAYDEALKIAKEYDPDLTGVRAGDIISDLFPELKENEDERIRKSLSAYFAKFKPNDMWDDNFSCGDIVAWFEVQGEQKPVGWDLGDEKMMLTIISDGVRQVKLDEGQIAWLKSLKDRVQPQSKQEWSEEERQIIEDAACCILACVNTAETKKEEERLEELADKLQDLRPQNRWKPSDEQMKALNEAIYHVDDSIATQIAMLIGDLKKLRDE